MRIVNLVHGQISDGWNMHASDIGFKCHASQLWSGILAQQVSTLAHQDQVAHRYPVAGVATAKASQCTLLSQQDLPDRS